MNILIINQPTHNRGDEAAHKALVRRVNTAFPNATVTTIFWDKTADTLDQMKVDYPNNHYVNLDCNTRGANFLSKVAVISNLLFLGLLSPLFRKMITYYNSADYIVCSPGGVNMGAFKSWIHLYTLQLARRKKIAYFSRSFGPFLNDRLEDRIFFNRSQKLLRGFDYICVRDNITAKIADSLNLQYTKGVDAAFLDQPQVVIPPELSYLMESDYCVFVPNKLTWHPYYKNVEQQSIDDFYLNVIDIIRLQYPRMKIVMLPQLFHAGKGKGDEEYFQSLKKQALYDNNIIIIEEIYSSDIQQKIISHSKFVVGARYHSIIFSINNNIPFLSLSYEHKMSGILEILGMNEYEVNIRNIGNNLFCKEQCIASSESILSDIIDKKILRDSGAIIAEQCFCELETKMESVAESLESY